MQKIIIKNFGPIKEAEIDIKQVLVLIGEQASGKSTIAKLIYFFETLNDDYKEHLNDSIRLNIVAKTLEELIKNKFYKFYGSHYLKHDLEILFYFDTKIETEKFIKIEYFIDDIDIQISTLLKEDYDHYFNLIRNSNLLPENLDNANLSQEEFIKIASLIPAFNRIKLSQNIELQSKLIFKNKHEYSIFIISGRNATVQYNDLFEKQLYAYVQNKIENNNNLKLQLQKQTSDEILTMKFMEEVSNNRNLFRINGGTFESMLRFADNKDILLKTEKKIEEILKGKYKVDKLGESILVKNNINVRIENASSGQQESIRILQDLFIGILRNDKVLRIIEEPEAHLFPIAQKQMVELLALMVNQNEGNTLIITTHSPYILTSFNNLLYAYTVVEEDKDVESQVEKIVEKEFRLNPKNFAAYTLVVTEDGYISESILSEKTGVIQANYLDSVSDILGTEFHKLYMIDTNPAVAK